MKKGLALLTTLGLAITGCTTNVFAADVVIKLADVQAENDVETQFEYKFAELVNEKSDGRIEVQVYARRLILETPLAHSLFVLRTK